MSTQNDEKNWSNQSKLNGMLIAPLAILVAILADFGLDFGLVLDVKEWNHLLQLQLQPFSQWHHVS